MSGLSLSFSHNELGEREGRMKRPEVICHMVSTIDGKIAGQSFAAEGLGPCLEYYGKTKQKFEGQATAYGASTAKEIFVGKAKETFKGSTAVTDESAYICGEVV